MAANAFDNTNLVSGLCAFNCNIAGFTPSVAYVYDPVAKTVVFTDGSTIPAGDTLTKVHVRVLDKNGKEVRDAITVTGGGGAKTVSVASLDPSAGLNITATVLTANHIAADGSAVNIGAAGSVGRWDSQQNA